MLIIKTCGEFDVNYNGVSLLDGTDVKRGLLLIYLWEQPAPKSRLEMARLLWPRVDDNTALVNLRSLFLRLRREGLGGYLDAGRSTVALLNRDRIDYDVARIRSLTTKVDTASLHDLTVVADLYRGPFLQTAALDEHPELHDWAATLRVEMEIRAIQALSLLVAQSITLGHADMVLSYAEHLVSLTPYEDQSQELYLRALSASGRTSDALNHFYQYQRLKKSKFHTEQVDNRLSELVDELKVAQLEPSFPQTLAVQDLSEQAFLADPNLPHRFPYIEYPLVGRHLESRRLLAMLDKGDRLITVIGIAGVGKTFLVRSQYDLLVARFGRAVYYADLRSSDVQPEQAANTLLRAIAIAIGRRLQPNKPLFEDVVDALSGEKCCLILDNFETVQPAASSVFALLQRIPGLCILITSRQQLLLPLESVLLLEGLSQMPTQQEAISDKSLDGQSLGKSEAIPYSDAVRYFEQCMQRQDLRYRNGDNSRLLIDSICRDISGLPLAIQLIAMQVSFYSLSELAALVRAGYAVQSDAASEYAASGLSGGYHIVWTVLDSMWQMLNDNQRSVLIELSIFAGAFHRDALTRVVPAPRTVYNSLINASLLCVDEPAWCSLHPLVKVYGAQRLPADAVVYQRYAHHFLSLFASDDRLGGVLTSQPLSIPLSTVRCQADVTLAWQWATNHAAWDLLDSALLRFAQYLNLTSQQEELIRLVSQLLVQLPPFEERSRLQHQLAGRAAYILSIHHDILPGQPMELWYERSLLWLNAAGDPWDIVVAALAYVNELLNRQPKSWERVDSLLFMAAHLIKEHQLAKLQLDFDFTLCAYLLYQGDWAQLRDTQESLRARLAYTTNSAWIAAQFVYIAFLDDWEQMLWLIDYVEGDNIDKSALPTAKQWGAHYLGNALAQSGDIAGAIAQRLSIINGYVDVTTMPMLSMAYAELALWQHITGDQVSAYNSAMQSISYAQRNLNSINTCFAQLFVASFFYLSGHTERSVTLLHNVLAHGRQFQHPTLIFSTLYYLAQIHAHRLPADLVQHILKIGAVSPAMHYVLRPLAHANLTVQGIEITEAARSTLWATSATDVKVLLNAIEEALG